MSRKRKLFVSESEVAELACHMLDGYWTLYLRESLPLALPLVDLIKEFWQPCICDPVFWPKGDADIEAANLHLHFPGCCYGGVCLECRKSIYTIDIAQHDACLRALQESVRQ